MQKKNCYYRELKQKLEKFIKMRNIVVPEQSADLEMTIDTIQTAIDKIKIIERETVEEDILYAYYNLKDYRFLWSFCENLAEYITDDMPKLPETTLKISDKEAMDLTHDFFKKCTPPDIYELFMHLFRQKKHFYFINESEPTFYADSLFLKFDKSFYAQMNRKYEFDDITTIAHEYGHGIQFLLNYHSSLFNQLAPFSEIISTFFELICTEYYTQDSSLGKIAISANYLLWDINCESALAITQLLQILKAIDIEKYETKQDLYENIALFIEANQSEALEELLETSPSNDFAYVLAYIIAIELFLIYQKDPEYAFYLIKRLIAIDLNLSPEHYLDEIVNLGILPGNGFDAFEKHMKRELTRL